MKFVKYADYSPNVSLYIQEDIEHSPEDSIFVLTEVIEDDYEVSSAQTLAASPYVNQLVAHAEKLCAVAIENDDSRYGFYHIFAIKAVQRV